MTRALMRPPAAFKLLSDFDGVWTDQAFEAQNVKLYLVSEATHPTRVGTDQAQEYFEVFERCVKTEPGLYAVRSENPADPIVIRWSVHMIRLRFGRSGRVTASRARGTARAEWRHLTRRPFRSIPLDSAPFRCSKSPRTARISAPVRSDPLESALFRSNAPDAPKHDLQTPEQKVVRSNRAGRTKTRGNQPQS